MLAATGALLIDQGEPDRGLGLLGDWIEAHPDAADIDIRLRYGDLLGSARRDQALTAWLDALRPQLQPGSPQSARLEDQALRAILRQTDDALAAKDYARAARLLDGASPAGRADRRHALELADLEREQGHGEAARAALAPLLADAPDDPEARLALARVL
jgi:uncharacterized protein HemY